MFHGGKFVHGVKCSSQSEGVKPPQAFVQLQGRLRLWDTAGETEYLDTFFTSCQERLIPFGIGEPDSSDMKSDRDIQRERERDIQTDTHTTQIHC